MEAVTGEMVHLFDKHLRVFASELGAGGMFWPVTDGALRVWPHETPPFTVDIVRNGKVLYTVSRFGESTQCELSVDDVVYMAPMDFDIGADYTSSHYWTKLFDGL